MLLGLLASLEHRQMVHVASKESRKYVIYFLFLDNV